MNEIIYFKKAKGKGSMTTFQLFERNKVDDGVFKKKMGDAMKGLIL